MELKSVRRAESPLGNGRIRVTGELAYPDRAGEELWFDVPGEVAGALSATGNPWLACLIPLAARRGENLRLCLPVDRVLAWGARVLPFVWKAWYPGMESVEIEADYLDLDDAPGKPSACGAFFTAGVDSFFTLLRSTEPGEIPVDDLITVWGFDVPLRFTEQFARRAARHRAIADRLGKRFVDVATNLRSTQVETAGWGPVSHACGLAGAGLMLEERYRYLRIAGTHAYNMLKPLGSHPQTDPLLSTSRTQVIHDGAAFNRMQKIEYLSRFPAALENLHVCFRAGSDYNCAKCEKCMRTMLALDVLGALPQASSFPGDKFHAKHAARIHLSGPGLERYYRQIGARAADRGRGDVVRVVARLIRRARLVRPIVGLLNRLSRRRGLWRASRSMRRVLLAGRHA